MDNLNTGILSRIGLPLPSLDEQQEILTFIATQRMRFDSLLSAYARQLEVLTEYRASLIHECVTGQRAVAAQEVTTAVTERKANVHFRRAVVGAEIIHRLHNQPRFGRVKLEKLLYLSEAYAGFELEGHYQRAAAGPFDNQALRSVESQIQRQQWYRAVKDDMGTQYTPMAKAGAHQTYFAKYWPEQQPKFEHIIKVLTPATTEQCEIVATLFAVWNDRLAGGKTFTDADLVDEVLTNWHPNKQKIDRQRWLTALEWMRKKDLIPAGSHTTTHAKP